MKNSKFIVAVIAGTVTFFLLGYLIFGLMLNGIIQSHSPLSPYVYAMVNKSMVDINWGAMIVSHLFMGLLYATVLIWGGFNSTAAGVRAGALLGFLTSGFFGFLMFGVTNIHSMTSLAANILGSVVMGAIGGAVIGMVLAKGTSAATA